MRPEPASWIAFALARADCARALRYTEDGAAEWLRQAALGHHVRVRFSRYYLERHHINMRLSGHPSHSTEEEREFPRRYWFPPLEEMERSPAAMAEHHIIHYTEWDAGQLRAALSATDQAEAASTSVGPAQAVKADRKGIGGAERKYPWDALGAAFGAWLHDEHGRADLGGRKHLDALADLAAKLGCEAPARTTALPYLAKWLQGYRAFLRED